MKARPRISVVLKMYLFFFIPPIIAITIGGFLLWKQIQTFSDTLIAQSASSVRTIAEEIITQKAVSVAAECRLYLENHPGFRKEEFNKTEVFRSLGVQKVGKTGYTGVYELAEVDGGCRTWAHVNPKLIGVDMRTLDKSLGSNFPDFWRIWSSVTRTKDAKGYYTWKDADGKIRAKYAACTVIQGTNFAVGATTYLDEFTEPVKQVESSSQIIVSRTRQLTLIISMITILLTSLTIFIYSRRLSSRIRSLTDAANRISTGDLEIQIKEKGNDEIGQLSLAIVRMQDSISLSLQRLRRRKS